MTDDLLSELRAIYAVEAAEHLATLNQTLLALETARDLSARRPQIEALERAAHSLKGSSRVVGMSAVESIAHRMESVFEGVRAERIALLPATADVLYDALDTLQAVLEGETVDLEPLLSALDGIFVENAPREMSAIPSIPPSSEAITSLAIRTMPGTVPNTDSAPPTDANEPIQTIRVAVHHLDSLIADTSDLLVARSSLEQRVNDVKALRKAHQRWQKEWRRVRTLYIRAVRAANPEWPALLEFLNGTQRYMRASGQGLLLLDRALAQDGLRISLIADSLQDSTRRARLVPFETHTATLQRTVRDIARQQDKAVLMQISGAALELDKRVLEAIKDPLIHLLRNAVDHGIEPPAFREAAGKPREGTIIIAVSQRGGDVLIIVADDGAGIDVSAVRQKARGLLTEAEVAALSDSEALALVMLPGLSTSDQITTISGRGIGLDIVRQNIESLQGRIMIESVPGQGTTFRLTLPISLSTLRCLLVRVGAEQYAIPTATIEQIVHVAAADLFTVGGRTMLRVEQRTVGVVTLADVIERPGGDAPAYALIMAVAERRMAFLVDDLLTEQEMVVKTLNPELAHLRHVNGATLLGTGEVVIILNTSDLLKTAQGIPIRRLEPSSNPTQTNPAQTPAAVSRILIVDDSITTRTLEKNILEASGYDVVTATNGLEALDVLAATPCDLVVADVEMPLMDGFELTRRIRHSERFAAMPVILVTSLDAPEHRERGLQVGADHYIVKGGFDQHELLQTIRQLL